ncbi:MAG TPA: cytochrome c [Anaerolineae bacterium]|nr:cytochrome c [Anaerolineae bacterium]
MIRRLYPLIVLVSGLGLLLFFAYEIIAVDWKSFMEDQPSIVYQEPPRRLPADEAVPISRPAWHDAPQTLVNPVPADEVSLQRGALLFDVHCAVCHGAQGQADGPVVEFWREDARRPANLTEQRIAQYPDAGLYQVITQGIGAMPPLRENVTERQIWDIINHVRTLQP